MILFHEASLILLTSMHTLFYCLLQDYTETVVTCFSGTVVPLAPTVQKVRIRSHKNYKVKVELIKFHFSLNSECLRLCQYRNAAWPGWLLGS